MNLRVKAVAPTDDYRLRLTFTNGESGEFDCRHLLNFEVFREFKEIAYFVRASVAHGTVVWPNGQDICPDTLYEDAVRLTCHSAEETLPPEPAAGPDSSGESSLPAR